MGLSNSFDFKLNRDALITRALKKIGALSASQVPTANELSDAAEDMNLMLKSWQTDGMQLWTVTQETVTPVAGREVYTMGPSGNITTGAKPVEIFEAYRRTTDTKVDVPINRLGRKDFWSLSDKDSQGTPVNYYFEIQQGKQHNLYIWPTADATFAANNTIEILYQKPFDDMIASNSNLAFPAEWELSVVLGLCVLLGPEYGLPTTDQKRIEALAAKAKDDVLDWDMEKTSIYIVPGMGNDA